MRYSFTILQDNAREKIVLETRSGESDRHIALKLLAYLLFRQDAEGLPLRIERAVGQRHKPDLVAADSSTGAVRLWIDCGQIETQRLGRIAARNAEARVYVLKATATEAAAYLRSATGDLPEGERGAMVAILGFDDGFVDTIVSVLRGANTVCVRTVSLQHLQLDWNGETAASTIHQFRPPSRKRMGAGA